MNFGEKNTQRNREKTTEDALFAESGLALEIAEGSKVVGRVRWDRSNHACALVFLDRQHGQRVDELILHGGRAQAQPEQLRAQKLRHHVDLAVCRRQVLLVVFIWFCFCLRNLFSK